MRNRRQALARRQFSFRELRAQDSLCHNKRMKSLTEHLWFETPHRRDYLNITDTVAGLVRKSGVLEGLCLVNAMHITTCVA
jgi:hypothetical protein